jgi:hypothetical protein
MQLATDIFSQVETYTDYYSALLAVYDNVHCMETKISGDMTRSPMMKRKRCFLQLNYKNPGD